MSDKLDKSLSSIIESNKPAKKPQQQQQPKNAGRQNAVAGARDRNTSNGNGQHAQDRDRRSAGVNGRERERQSDRQDRDRAPRYDDNSAAAAAAFMQYAPQHFMPEQQQSVAPVVTSRTEQQLVGTDVFISNLAPDVNSQDLRDIFDSVGPIKSASVNYTEQGKSAGTAQVVFQQAKHAARAVAEYDSAEVDGRPISLKLIGRLVAAPKTVVTAAPQAASPYGAAAAYPQFNPAAMLAAQQALTQAMSMQQRNQSHSNGSAAVANGRQSNGSHRDEREPRGRRQDIKSSTRDSGRQSGGARPERNQGGAKSQGAKPAGKPKRQERTPVDMAALDAEMDAYKNQTSQPQAEAPVAAEPAKAASPKAAPVASPKQAAA